MTRKILSVFLSVLLMASLLFVPTTGVFADEIDLSNRPAGIAFANYGAGQFCGFTVQRDSITNYYTVTAPQAVDTSGDGAVFNASVDNPAPGWQATFAADAFVKDTTYVISFKVRNENPDVPTKVVFGLTDGTMGGSAQGYAWKGQYVWAEDVTGSDWQTVTKTVTLAYNGSNRTKLVIGLGMGNTHSTYSGKPDLALIPNSSITVDVNSVYIAQEVPYACALVNELSAVNLSKGRSYAGSIKVLNQIGEKGSLEQSASYVVTDAEGAVAEDFTVQSGANGAYTLTVSANAQVGDYVITATNDTTGVTVSDAVQFTVCEPFLYDSEEGTDPLYGIEITAGGDYPNVLGAFGTYTMNAKLVDSNGQIGSNVQDFKWYAVTEDRTALVTEGFVITTSDGDSSVATVKVNPDIAEDNYYIIAESVAAESLGMLKGFEITVDKSRDADAFASLLKNEAPGAADTVAQNLNASIAMLGLGGTVVADADAGALVSLMMANAQDAQLDSSNIADYVTKNAIISLYNVNNSNIALSNADGSFTYEEDLALSSIDSNGVTLWDAFKNTISAEGMTSVHSEMARRTDYTGYSDFVDELKTVILLEAVENPVTFGTGYLDTLLTSENLAAAGIDATGYLALGADDKTIFNSGIARGTYTKATLENVLKNATAAGSGSTGGTTGGLGGSTGSTGSGSGSSGSFGGSGGASKNPTVGIGSTIVVDDDADKEDSVKETAFADVSTSHWAYSDIHFLREIGAVSGISEELFDPEGVVTREQFLKMLIDALKLAHTKSEVEFADVVHGSWYDIYVQTGVANAITTGKNSQLFGVGESITRQDVCTMVVRALKLEIPENPTAKFNDFNMIASYAQGPVAVLTEYAIINGFVDNTFRPTDVCTRAQAAKIIANAVNVANILK